VMVVPIVGIDQGQPISRKQGRFSRRLTGQSAKTNSPDAMSEGRCPAPRSRSPRGNVLCRTLHLCNDGPGVVVAHAVRLRRSTDDCLLSGDHHEKNRFLELPRRCWSPRSSWGLERVVLIFEVEDSLRPRPSWSPDGQLADEIAPTTTWRFAATLSAEKT